MLITYLHLVLMLRMTGTVPVLPVFVRVACTGTTLLAGLHSQSPRHFAWKLSVRVSETVRLSCLSHMVAAAILADKYWHPPPLWLQERTDLRAHTDSRTLPTCDMSTGSCHSLPTHEAGDFVVLILLNIFKYSLYFYQLMHFYIS